MNKSLKFSQSPPPISPQKRELQLYQSRQYKTLLVNFRTKLQIILFIIPVLCSSYRATFIRFVILLLYRLGSAHKLFSQVGWYRNWLDFGLNWVRAWNLLEGVHSNPGHCLSGLIAATNISQLSRRWKFKRWQGF